LAQATIDALLRQAVAAHGAGDLALAERLYRRVLRAAPTSGDALNLLGIVARQRGDLAQALSLSAQALATAPDSPVFLAARGAALAEAGRFPEAIAALQATLARRPRDIVSLRNLGQALAASGQAAAALAPLRQAVALAPGAPEAWLALAHAAREAGDATLAIQAAARVGALPGVPADLAEQAAFIAAALRGAAPSRAPAAYVRALFDQYAPRFDADLEGQLGYRTPALLAALLAAQGVAPDGSRRVLDLGCGTGLSGLALRPFARHLTGIDLSPRMLAVARDRGLYDSLAEADLLAWLPAHPGAFDLVAAADVLNYLGELGPALQGIGASLAPGGVAAFSLERGEGGGYALGPGLRYRHDPALLPDLLAAAGLRLLAREDVVLRQEKGAPVDGALILADRNPG
jgi:predicted TPR repeat methyltransferase